MKKISIKGKEFDLRYTIESWKKLKEKCDLTPSNFQEKFVADMSGCLGQAIFYGLTPKDREEIKVEDIEAEHGFEIIDSLTEAIMESMPKSVKSQMTDKPTGN